MSTKNAKEVNSDEAEAPAWINEEFFLKVLQECEKDKSIKVLSVATSAASAKGDHYSSLMFRSNVEYQQGGATKTKSLIVKAMPHAEGLKKDIMGQSHAFETEIGMYAEVIPRMEKILKDAGDNVILAPLCLYHSLSPHKCLVMEDIVPKGYVSQQNSYFNNEELKAILSKIAKWHAVSYKIALEEPTYFDQYRHHPYELQSLRQSSYIKNSIDNFIAMLRKQSDLVKYIPFIEGLKADFVDRGLALYDEYRKEPKANGLYVLCHGDFHLKNVMLKHNQQNGELEDVLLHDFQFSYMGTMANDLIFALFCMFSGDALENHREELLYFYFTTFQETLRKIGFKGSIPKLVDFYKHLMDHRHFEVFKFICGRATWTRVTRGPVDFDEMLVNAKVQEALWLQEIYVQEVRKMLPKFLYKGFLEP